MHVLIGQNCMFYGSVKRRKSAFAFDVRRTQHNRGIPVLLKVDLLCHSFRRTFSCAILNNLSRFVHDTRVLTHSFPVSYKACISTKTKESIPSTPRKHVIINEYVVMEEEREKKKN